MGPIACRATCWAAVGTCLLAMFLLPVSRAQDAKGASPSPQWVNIPVKGLGLFGGSGSMVASGAIPVCRPAAVVSRSSCRRFVLVMARQSESRHETLPLKTPIELWRGRRDCRAGVGARRGPGAVGIPR